jgi:hypothetical protein
MSATQQHDTSLVFTGAFIILITVLFLLAFPLIQSAMEVLNDSVVYFLSALNAEVGRSLGR